MLTDKQIQDIGYDFQEKINEYLDGNPVVDIPEFQVDQLCRLYKENPDKIAVQGIIGIITVGIINDLLIKEHMYETQKDCFAVAQAILAHTFAYMFDKFDEST